MAQKLLTKEQFIIQQLIQESESLKLQLLSLAFELSEANKEKQQLKEVEDR